MKHPFLPLAVLGVAAGLSSCAYVQTHKNVRELGTTYKGYRISNPSHVYRSGGTWYLAATPAEFRLHRPFVHDSVFRKKDDSPELRLLREDTTRRAYHAISDGTAAVLMRSDGYAESATLASEIRESKTPWLDSIPHATAYPVQARLEGTEKVSIATGRDPQETPLVYTLLGHADFIFIDIPCTLVYNVCIPFAAPVIFWKEFTSGS